MVYRGVMGLTIVGLALTFFSFGQMALGIMEKKKWQQHISISIYKYLKMETFNCLLQFAVLILEY